MQYTGYRQRVYVEWSFWCPFDGLFVATWRCMESLVNHGLGCQNVRLTAFKYAAGFGVPVCFHKQVLDFIFSVDPRRDPSCSLNLIGPFWLKYLWVSRDEACFLDIFRGHLPVAKGTVKGMSLSFTRAWVRCEMLQDLYFLMISIFRYLKLWGFPLYIFNKSQNELRVYRRIS